MSKRILFCVFALMLAVVLTGVAESAGKEGTWVGWVTDTHCGAPKGDPSKSKHAPDQCVKAGAQYALYTPSDKKIYVLVNPDKVAEHAGHHVKISGTLDGDKITIKSIETTGEQKGATK